MAENKPIDTLCTTSRRVGVDQPSAANTSAPEPKRTTTVAAAANQVLMPGACAESSKPSALITGKLSPHNAQQPISPNSART